MLSIFLCICFPSVCLLWKNFYSVYLTIFIIIIIYLFIFLLYNIVLVLPYINRHPPQVYTCSPSWTPLPPPSPYHPSGSFQCTSPKLPVSCINPGLESRFLYDIWPFLNWIVCSFDVELHEFFIYFGYKPLIRYIVCKYILLFSRPPFCFVDNFLHCVKAF